MPVVTNELTQNTQADGRISITLRLFDQDGTEVLATAQLLPAGIDVQAWLANRIFEIDTQLAENEFRAIVGL
jgi:primosomal protein N'